MRVAGRGANPRWVFRPSHDGLTPQKALKAINERVEELAQEQLLAWQELQTALPDIGVHICGPTI